MKIYGVGGYSEVGKNMTVVELEDDAFIFDAGLYIPAVIELQEENTEASEKSLRRKGALPNDLLLDKLGLRKKIRAVLLSHAHLDHVGAAPYIGYRYNAPILGSPYTISVLKGLLKDEKKKIPNKMKSINPNSSFVIKGKKRNYEVEFLNMTHSTLQTTMIALHTPEGVVIYGNDFKLDNTPVMGPPPNYRAMQRISKEGVKAAIIDSLYCGSEKKTPSEKVARDMVGEVLLTTRNENHGLFVSTFSSHIARLKSIVEFGKKLDRKIVFVGRSMKKYMTAAEEINLAPFKKDVQLVTYKNQVNSMLKKINNEREKYMVVCTGHQGEPGSVLERISRRDLPFEFRKKDHIVFSSKTIPVQVNIENKGMMDKRLKKTGVRLFDEVHVSGHGGREDLRDLIELLNPEHIIPSHGPLSKTRPMYELTREMGYRPGKNVHLLEDGKKLDIK